MTLVDFLLMCIAEDEAVAREAGVLPGMSWEYEADPTPAPIVLVSSARVLAECASKRQIIEWHRNWPVLVETEPTFEQVGFDGLDSMTMRLTSRIKWLTQQEYVALFGKESPAAPILRMMAAVYSDHPHYNAKEWAL